MAEQVAIPAGVNPASAVPSDAGTYGSARGAAPGAPAADGGIPAVAPAAAQQPGFVPPATPAAPAGTEAAEFAAFKAWQAEQAKAAAKPVPTAPATPTTTAAEQAGEGFGPQGALDAVKAAAGEDPILSSTFEMFGLVAPDVDLARAIGTAIDRADLSLIDRAYLRDAGGDKAEKLIKLAEGMVKHVNTQVESMVTSIHTAAGGEAQWAASSASFNKDAPSYLKQYVVDQLNSANPTKIKAGVDAVLDFVKKSGALPVAPQGHIRAGGGTPDASLGLSKEQYQAERLKLNRFDRDYNDRARELDARRVLGKKAGL